MKRLSKILSLLCMLAMALGCLGLTTLAEESAFAGGSGTEADPSARVVRPRQPSAMASMHSRDRIFESRFN